MYFYVCTYLKATVNKCNKVFFIYFISLAYPIAFIEGENPRAKSASAVGVSNTMSFDFFTRKNHGVIRSLRGLLIWGHPRPLHIEMRKAKLKNSDFSILSDVDPLTQLKP